MRTFIVPVLLLAMPAWAGDPFDGLERSDDIDRISVERPQPPAAEGMPAGWDGTTGAQSSVKLPAPPQAMPEFMTLGAGVELSGIAAAAGAQASADYRPRVFDGARMINNALDAAYWGD